MGLERKPTNHKITVNLPFIDCIQSAAMLIHDSLNTLRIQLFEDLGMFNHSFITL